MVWNNIGDVYVIVHESDPPTDDEWDQYLADIRSHDLEKMRTLVFTTGGAPTANQRKKLNAWLNGRTTYVCLVSKNILVQGVVTALSWFNPKTKSVLPHRVEEAFSYLQIPLEERDKVWALVGDLRKQLNAKGTVSRGGPVV
jgi:hypothetical protein